MLVERRKRWHSREVGQDKTKILANQKEGSRYEILSTRKETFELNQAYSETKQVNRNRKGKDIENPKRIERAINTGISKNSTYRKAHKAPRTQPIYVNPIFDG